MAKARKAAEETAGVIVKMGDEAYRFPPGTDPEVAQRYLWNEVVKPRAKGLEEKIELPSELPKEKQEALNQPSAEIIPFKRMEPGMYLDEETGKYYQITKDGEMKEVPLDASSP